MKTAIPTMLLVGSALAGATAFGQEDAPRAIVKLGLVKKARLQFMKADGGVAGDAHAIDLTYAVSNGKQDRGNLVAVYEPTTGLFWWKLETIGRNRKVEVPATTRLSFCLMNGKFVGIESTDVRLWISESSEKYKTFELGLNDLTARLEKNLVPSKEKKQSHRAEDVQTEVDLSSVLGRDFFKIKNSAAPLVAARITNAAESGSRCLITLEGVNKDKATLTLSGDYKIQAATLNGVQIVPK